MKKKVLVLFLSAVTAVSMMSGALTVAAEDGVSTLFPDGDGVKLTAASYNEAAPDWTEYDELIAGIKSTTDMEELSP